MRVDLCPEGRPQTKTGANLKREFYLARSNSIVNCALRSGGDGFDGEIADFR